MGWHLPIPPPNLGNEIAMGVPGLLATAREYWEHGGRVRQEVKGKRSADLHPKAALGGHWKQMSTSPAAGGRDWGMYTTDMLTRQS